MGRYYQSWVEGLITGGLDIDANSSTNTRIVVKNYVEDYQGNSVWDGTLTVFQGTFTENSGKYSGPVSKILHIDYNGGNPKTLLEVDMPQGQEPDFSTFQNDFDHAVQLHNDMKAVGLDTDNASFASAQGGTEIVLDNGDGYLIRFTGTNLPTSDIHHPNEIDASATFTKVEKIDPNTNSVVASKDYSASPENARFFVKAVFEPTMIVTDDFLSGDNTITTFNLAFGDGIYIHTGAGTDTVDTATNTPDAFVSIMAEDNQDVIHTGSASNSELDFSAYYSGGQGVSVDLTAAAQNNTITGIRDITGSNYDDALTGDDNSNNLSGGAGDDLIDGAGGWDTVDYSDADTAVNVDLSAGTASDGQGGTDTLINIENVIGSDFDDTITGDANDNIFNGNRGDDTINGGGGNDIFLTSFGNDTFDGGSGTLDTVDYEISNQAVNVDLANHTASDGLGGTDTLQNIEAVIGSPYDDTLTGDGGDNILSGYYGDDTINGGGGADILRGGSGSDVIAGGDDNDRLIGGAGDDRLTGGAGADTFAYDGQLDQNGNPITPDFGNDEITDLDASADKIRLDMFVDDGGSIRPINRNDVDITDDGSGGSYITAKNPAYFSGQIHVRNSDPTTTETAME
ncbi:calcium-binding protein, partial [Thermopetrobacter sp. TC1]|uniref:calcium-binding protein n=1 Tax=Thermopetrobacter sp. TC1 TaxID=1495045 RepID=UPI000571D30F